MTSSPCVMRTQCRCRRRVQPTNDRTDEAPISCNAHFPPFCITEAKLSLLLFLGWTLGALKGRKALPGNTWQSKWPDSLRCTDKRRTSPGPRLYRRPVPVSLEGGPHLADTLSCERAVSLGGGIKDISPWGGRRAEVVAGCIRGKCSFILRPASRS
ncbi:hypothetical protein C8R47DRAFT_141631 [Mycena vitilis]|nr:hypothetical protein C8R47DRAFT_141631 [Mycena vitilis]